MTKKTLRTDLGNLLKSSYLPQKKAAEKMKSNGYTYDNQLSSMNTKVFIDKNNKPVIVHRGSKTVKDFIDDGLLAVGLGKYGHRYKNAVRITKKAEEKYQKPADSVGHSYGGWLAEKSKNKGDTITYNKAAGLGDILQKQNKKQVDVMTKGDIVSGLTTLQNNKKEILDNNHLFPNAYNAHNLDSLFPLASST